MSQLRVTLERSSIGNPKDQKDTVYTLGLHRMHQTVLLPDNPSVRGMLHKVRHLVRVQTVEGSVEESVPVATTVVTVDAVEPATEATPDETAEQSGVES